MIEYFEQPVGLAATNGYSHTVVGTGRLVIVSGQLPVDESGALVGLDDPMAQARQVFTNLGAALRAAGAASDDVVGLGIFLTDLADLGAVRTARDDFLGDGPRPASSLVRVAGLVLPDARIEIDALAVTGPGTLTG